MKNNRGQALVEAMIILPLIIFSAYLIISSGLFLILNLALDDLLEKALVCELQHKKTCIFELENELKLLNLKEISIQHKTTDTYASLNLNANSNLNRKLTKQVELTLDLIQ